MGGETKGAGVIVDRSFRAPRTTEGRAFPIRTDLVRFRDDAWYIDKELFPTRELLLSEPIYTRIFSQGHRQSDVELPVYAEFFLFLRIEEAEEK